jgi:hypothetical protein
MIREERSPAFWQGVADHPEVSPTAAFDASIIVHPRVMPLASEHGGYLFVQIDGLGRVWDLHAAFLPAGWGREASEALKAALRRLEGWMVVSVSEVDGNWRSRPPRSFGFRPAGPFEGGYRSWILTRDAWERSPVRRRTE